MLVNRLSKLTIATAVIGSMLMLGFLFVNSAIAHQDPVNCTETGVGLSLAVFRSDGTTTISGGQTVTPGELVKYRATLSHLGGANCNYEGGTLTITTPDGVVHTVASPATPVVPLVSTGNPFASVFVDYTVDSADVGGDSDIDASSNYTGGSAHSGESHDVVTGSATRSTPFELLDSRITTEVHDAAHTDITNTTVAFGTDVHDEATIAGTTEGGTPTGTVDFTLMTGLVCDGQTLDTDLDVALNGSGVAESSVQTDLAAGQYSYSVHYDGDANYNPATASCEPFTIINSLVIEKTASARYDREWTWTIDKSADQTDLLLAEGQSFTVNYDVVLGATSEDTNHTVTGTITITNPVGNPNATISGITDTLDDSGNVAVDCSGNPNGFISLPHVIGAGESLICTYTQTNATSDDSLNTVVVATSGSVPGGQDTADVEWGAPANIIDECIVVDDTNPQGPQDVVVCAGDADKTLEYEITFGPAGGEGVDVAVECGENTFPNTASFVTQDDENDTGATGSDTATVNITVECNVGCTLTQGYWKTHNDSFKGGAPTDDTWDLLPGGLAENTIFFLSTKTWFNVFWTAPKGNAYYNLAHQYMAAKLNILNGASTTPAVDTAITNAETWFNTYTPAQIGALKGNNALRKQFIEAAGILGSYNEGLIGPGHCDEDSTSAPN